MRFISSVCWVPVGKSKTPTQLKIEQNEMKKIFGEEEGKKRVVVDDEDEENPVSGNEANESGDDVDKRYNLDDYDNEEDEIRVEQLNSLACFSNNHDDALLTRKDDGEDSDGDDYEIRKDDNLLLAGHFDEDICSLNVYVYNRPDRHFYIHHDLMLPSYPVCLEWMDFDPTETGSVNYLAIGSLNPWIEIWDLDIVDCLEPEFILGSQKKIKKKLPAGVKKQKILGHRGPVLSLAWNNANKTVLASGSTDKSIILWDLQKLKLATRIKNHTDNVQSLQWHPIELFSLLSGSADKTVCMYDCRNPNTNKKSWSLGAEVEEVTWNKFDPNYFLCCDNEGSLNMFDIRMDAAVVTLKAHEESIGSLSMSSTVPGLLLTGSEDESVKIWDVTSSGIEMVHSKQLKIGGINTIKTSPESGFVFGIGGAKDSAPIVWDVQEVAEVRRAFYPRMNIPLEILAGKKEDIEEAPVPKRTGRSKNFLTSKKFENKRKKINEERQINKSVIKKAKK